MAQEDVGLRFVVSGRGAAVGAFGSVRSSIGSVRGAALAAAGALYGVGRALASSIDEAREAERVGKVTENRLKTTGHAANVTAREIGRYATQLSRKTGIDDEAIQSGSNLLLTFTKIRNETGKGNRIFDRAVTSATNLAATMAGSNRGLSLKSSAILVGKALNDPVKGITAMTRVGVSFTKQQVEQVKALVDNGRQLQAQKLILRELRTEFGGTAQAQATMGDKVSVAWGNIQEKLGTALLPLLDRVERAFLRQGVPAINRYLDVFQDRGIPAIQGFVREARPVAEEIIPAIGSGLQTTLRVLRKAAPYAADLVGAFNDAPDWVKTGLGVGALGLFAARKLGAGKAVSSALGKYGGATPVWVVNQGGGPGSGVDPKGIAATIAGLVAKLAKSPFVRGPALLTAVYAALGNGTSQAPEQRAAGPKPGSRPFLGFNAYQRYQEVGGPKNFLNKLLYDPVIGIQKGASASRLNDLYRGSLDVQRGLKGATDRATELQRSIDFLSGTSVMLNLDPASRQIAALKSDLLSVITLASGGLFGGGDPDTTSLLTTPMGGRGGRGGRRSPRRPMSVPSVAPRVVVPSGMSGSGFDGRPIVLQTVLDGRVVAESTVDRLQDQEARR